jgi:hypothetical protein
MPLVVTVLQEQDRQHPAMQSAESNMLLPDVV